MIQLRQGFFSSKCPANARPLIRSRLAGINVVRRLMKGVDRFYSAFKKSLRAYPQKVACFTLVQIRF